MLYTRQGDKGTTTICNTGGGRIPKSSLLIEALGNVDELNAWLGFCKAKLKDSILKEEVEDIQQCLFIVQAEIAGANKTITKERINGLERKIDDIEKQLPAIKTFLMAGASEISACFDVARTLARRTERRVIDAVENDELNVSDSTRVYLNRLSSLFYAMERLLVRNAEVEERPPNYE